MEKWSPLVGFQIHGTNSLITPPSLVRWRLLLGIHATIEQLTSGKAISQGTTSSISLKFGIPSTWAQKLASCGPLGIKLLSMVGGLASPQHVPPSNVFLWLPNTSKSRKHKFWDCIQVRQVWWWATFIIHKLCRAQTGNHTSFNWKQTLFRERTLRSLLRNPRCGTFSEASTSRRFGLEGVIGCLIMNEQWHEAKMKHLIWDNLIMYAKVVGSK